MANYDNDQSSIPFQRFDRWATFIFSNLAWIVFALPIITVPLGTVGLFQVMSLWARGKQPEFFMDFFGAIRRYWWKAFLIGLIDLVVGGVTFANLRFLNTTGFDDLFVLFIGSMNVFVAIIVLMANMYIWSLLVVAEFGLRQIVLLSLKLIFANLFETAATLIMASLPLVFAVVLPLPALLWLLGLISLSTLIINKGTWHVIRRYVPESELLKYENSED